MSNINIISFMGGLVRTSLVCLGICFQVIYCLADFRNRVKIREMLRLAYKESWAIGNVSES